MARGCAVVAPASDFSSFNIYYYGGFDGIHQLKDYSDQVWVLSLPSFTWTLINEGRPQHARSGHKCFMPYPDQMLAFGGYTSINGTNLACLDQGPVVNFNLTSGQWMDSYAPSRFAPYGVHSSVVRVVGGDSSGGAKVTSPLPSGWSSKELGDIFATPYDRTKLTHHWPYATTPSPPASPTPSAVTVEPSTSPSLRAALPLIIVPLVFIAGLAVALWYMCVRRKRRGPYSTSDSTAVDSSRNVIMWLRGQRWSKQLTVSESHVTSNELEGSRGEPDTTPEICYEMPDNQVSELSGMNHDDTLLFSACFFCPSTFPPLLIVSSDMYIFKPCPIVSNLRLTLLPPNQVTRL